MDYVYHGSGVANITILEARSKLHESNENIVYLTGNIPYALMYIWSEEKMGTSQKHVTCGIKNGVVLYQEQFPNQLKEFYQGVSGYLYYVTNGERIKAVSNRESMYYTLDNVKVDKVIHIEDVYEEFLKYEKAGLLKVFRFNNLPLDEQEEMTKNMADYFKKMNLFQDNKEKADFFEKYFKKAWYLSINSKKIED